MYKRQVWDKESGQPIYFAIVWQSRQSDSYCEAFKAQGLEEMIKEKTGLLLDPYFSASKIRFILDHVAGAQERAERGELLFGTMDTWLLWKLSQGAKHMSDVSNASRTMLMNLKTLDYDEELLKLWNIPRCMLPEIHDTSEVYGYTSEMCIRDRASGLTQGAMPLMGYNYGAGYHQRLHEALKYAISVTGIIMLCGCLLLSLIHI